MMTPPAEHRSSVKRSLTPKRRRRLVENDDSAAFIQRVIRAHSRRVASGDIDALTGMANLSGDLDHAIAEAITALRTQHGYSWADIGTRLGITRQAAQQRWGGTSSTVTTPNGTGRTGSRP